MRSFVFEKVVEVMKRLFDSDELFHRFKFLLLGAFSTLACIKCQKLNLFKAKNLPMNL